MRDYVSGRKPTRRIGTGIDNADRCSRAYSQVAMLSSARDRCGHGDRQRNIHPGLNPRLYQKIAKHAYPISYTPIASARAYFFIIFLASGGVEAFLWCARALTRRNDKKDKI